MSRAYRSHVYIASLGLFPQLVTISLDLLTRYLQQQGVHGLTRAYILHSHPSGHKNIAPALDLLKSPEDGLSKHFGLLPVNETDRMGRGTVEFHTFHLNGQPLPDIKHPAEARAAFSLIYNKVQQEKQAGAVVHLMAASGRKIMVMWALLAAQLLFTDDEDRLWDLWSTPELEQSGYLFPANGVTLDSQLDVAHPLADAILFRVPVLPWSSNLARKARFLNSVLSPREREVIALMAGEGLNKRQLAERLSISPKVVDDHVQSIARKWEDFEGLEHASGTPLYFIRQEFSPYFYIARLINEATRISNASHQEFS